PYNRAVRGRVRRPDTPCRSLAPEFGSSSRPARASESRRGSRAGPRRSRSLRRPKSLESQPRCSLAPELSRSRVQRATARERKIREVSYGLRGLSTSGAYKREFTANELTLRWTDEGLTTTLATNGPPRAGAADLR